MKNRKYSDSPLFAILMIFVMWFVLYLANQDLLLAEPRIGAQSATTVASKYVMLEQSITPKVAANKSSDANQGPVVYKQLEPMFIDSASRRVMNVSAPSFSDSSQFLSMLVFLVLILLAGLNFYKACAKQLLKDNEEMEKILKEQE